MRLRAHLAVLLVCLALVAWGTWPLIRDPAHLVPDNTDPRLFSWVMISVFRNLLTRPALLLHGSGFYPYGGSLTFAEPLVTPALVAGPLFWLTGNPYLAYNLTLLLFWALSGWAMYAVAYALTRRHAAAAAAMLVFTLAPPRIEYAVEFQMEIMFGLPLCVYALVRWLESQRPRYLVAFLVVFWLQAVAVWYFAVILGCGLMALALSVALRRWSGWRPRALVAAAGSSAALLVALLPVAWPFFVTRAELGLERGTGEALDRSANALAYLTTTGTWLAQVVRISFASETTLFPGLVALGLAGVGTAWLWGPRERRVATGWPERLVAAAMGLSLLLATWSVVGEGRLRIGRAWTYLPLTAGGVVLLGAILLRDLLAGWRRWRGGLRDRALTEGEWVSSLGAMGLLALLLSFGPLVFVGEVPAGSGLYAWLHPYLLPLRAIRGTTRFGLLVLTVVALLAGLGVAWLATRVPPRRRGPAMAAVLALLLLDYVRAPLPYQWIPRYTRAVDAALRSDPDDVVALEWPLNSPFVDVDAKLRTVGHGKRVVNGFAGFVPDFQRELSGLLSEGSPPLSSATARTAMARIYPLRYLVVRHGDLAPEDRPGWQALRTAPPALLRLRGSYGADDLYEIVPLPERGVVLERVVAYDLLRTRPVLRARLRPVRTQPGVEQWVTVSLNGAALRRLDLPDEGTVLSAPLPGPVHRVAPNLIALQHGFRRGPAALGPAHRIGTTGVTGSIDALVRSGGQPHGDVASIRVGVADLASNRRGYNLVALDPSGALRARAVFDTFGDDSAAARLVAWVQALPAGTVVLGAVKDEASAALDAAAVAALATLGVGGDLRGRYRESHAFIGVKGAPAGSAIEALGPRPVEVRVGEPEAGFGIELTEFALERAVAR